MKTPLASLFIQGVFFLFIFSSSLTANAQHSLPKGYFELWDEDHNTILSHAEFYRGMRATSYFERWDTNSDSGLNREEVYEGLKALHISNSESASVQVSPVRVTQSSTGQIFQQDLDKIFKMADLNRNESLNKAEFYTYIFRVLDKDGNGKLSLLESHPSRLTVFSGNL